MVDLGGKSRKFIFVGLIIMHGILFSFYLNSTNENLLRSDYSSSLISKNYFLPQLSEITPVQGQRVHLKSPSAEDESWRKVKVLCFVLTHPKALG